jgi:hypothetical protein
MFALRLCGPRLASHRIAWAGWSGAAVPINRQDETSDDGDGEDKVVTVCT